MANENKKKNKKLSGQDVEIILVGLIFTLFGLICITNCGPVGKFFFYISTYLFGLFSFLPFVLIIIAGIYFIIFKKAPKTKFGSSFIGVILLLVGFAISSSNSSNLNLSNMMSEFNIAYHDVSLFNVPSWSSTIACGGGFIGYALAALLCTTVTYAGTIVIYIILILTGLVLTLKNPIINIVTFFKELKARKYEPREDELDKEVSLDIDEKTPTQKEIVEDRYDAKYFDDDTDLSELNSAYHKPTIKANKAVFVHEGMKKPQSSEEIKNEDESLSDQKDNDLPILDLPSEEEIKNIHEDTSNDSLSYNDELENDYNDNEKIEDDIPLFENQEKTEEHENDELEQDYLKEDEYEDAIIENDEGQEYFQKDFVHEKIDDTFSHSYSAPIIKNQNERRGEEVDDFVYPSIDLLNEYEDEHVTQLNFEASTVRKDKINNIFGDLKLGAKVTGFRIGPSVTRFEIETNKDVSVNTISKYIEDVSVRLGGVSARFEKVVAGMSVSGLEIPNKKSVTVSLKECLQPYVGKPEEKYKIPLGKNIAGDVIGVNITDFPHLLVAGSTGSGKSIFVHNLIMSLIMKTKPSECKIVLIDPKHVEMSRYKEMPHLMCPILTDIVPCRNALNKLVMEMENRYTLFELAGVSNLKQYNKQVREENQKDELPVIVVIIDEYADLVDSYKDISVPVVRLAQKSRAAGIHLVISTQRPSVNVITGVIKANLPTRVALRVASPTDSMTILGEGGAEKLLGYGDLLVDSPEINGVGLTRLQSPFVDNSEVRKVVNFLKENYKCHYHPNFLDLEDSKKTSYMDESGNDTIDELYDDVREWVVHQNEVSVSLIQRYFKFGFNRAARIVDALKEEGLIVKDGNGTAARYKVLKDEIDNIN